MSLVILFSVNPSIAFANKFSSLHFHNIRSYSKAENPLKTCAQELAIEVSLSLANLDADYLALIYQLCFHYK